MDLSRWLSLGECLECQPPRGVCFEISPGDGAQESIEKVQQGVARRSDDRDQEYQGNIARLKADWKAEEARVKAGSSGFGDPIVKRWQVESHKGWMNYIPEIQAQL